MSYFIKPVLWAGLGLATIAGVTTYSKSNSNEPAKEAATEPAKDPAKDPEKAPATDPAKAVVAVEENRTDGHYEIQLVNETRYDARGFPYVVQVQRRVWVDDVVVYTAPTPTYYYSTPYYYSAPYYSSPYYYSGPYYSSGPTFSFRFGGGHRHR